MPRNESWILKQLSTDKKVYVLGIKRTQLTMDIVTFRNHILRKLKEKKHFQICATQVEWKTWIVITPQGVQIEDSYNGKLGEFIKHGYQKN